MSDDQNDESASTARVMTNSASGAAEGGGPTTPSSQRAGENGNGEACSPQKSCLSGSGDMRRVDSLGCPIERVQKQHKISFRDQVQAGVPVHEVREVKAFKNNNNTCTCSLM